MASLPKWIPTPSGCIVQAAPRPAGLRWTDISAKDQTFCAEFAAHGGIAMSTEGFKAETELVRMQNAGMLTLERDPAAPFLVARVTLSTAMQALLSGTGPERNNASAANPSTAREPATKTEAGHRRHGFEVARGMINAAVKAEISAWEAGTDPDASGLAARIMTRIGRIEAPFAA